MGPPRGAPLGGVVLGGTAQERPAAGWVGAALPPNDPVPPAWSALTHRTGTAQILIFMQF